MSLKPPILTVGKFEFYAVTETGMSFVPETPRLQWLEAVQRLTNFYEGSAMAKERCLMLLADALNFGEKAYGEDFSQAVNGMRQELGLSPKTIANAQWVYGKIDAKRRRDGLTLGHMSVIAALPEEAQEKLMDEVIEGHLTVTDLKTEVADRFPKTKRGKERKKKAATASEDDADSVLRKLDECGDWLAKNKPTASMKESLANCYRAYRREWMGGHKK